MEAPVTVISANPAGETKTSPQYPSGTWPLDTPGGRFYAEWDDQAPVTREGQLIFFFQFLQAGGRWEEFLRHCPLHYTGNRGSGALNVMGTVLLSVLSGHWRYAHINGLRGDGINPGLLGMSGTVSEDAVRLAMTRIEETAGLDWLSTQILGRISPALGLPWILDIDVTVKPLYGHQQGAEIGYNPQKPGRPATSITATSLPTCASVSVWKCDPATNTPPPKDSPAFGKPSKNSPATNGPPSPVATAATAASSPC